MGKDRHIKGRVLDLLVSKRVNKKDQVVVMLDDLVFL
jgi:hypothetical protein